AAASHALEEREGRLPLAQAQEHLAQPGHGVLVVRLEGERLLEGAPGPRELLSREARVAEPDVELDRVGVEKEPILEHLERAVVVAVVVETMRTLVVILRAEERSGHAQRLLSAS